MRAVASGGVAVKRRSVTLGPVTVKRRAITLGTVTLRAVSVKWRPIALGSVTLGPVTVKRRAITLGTVTLRAVTVKRRPIALGSVTLRPVTRSAITLGTIAAKTVSGDVIARRAFIAERRPFGLRRPLRRCGGSRLRKGLGGRSLDLRLRRRFRSTGFRRGLRLCRANFGLRLRRRRCDGALRRSAGLSRSGFRISALLLLQGDSNGPLTGVLFFLTQPAGRAALLRTRLLLRALRLRVWTCQVGISAGARLMLADTAWRRRANPALGFHYNRFGAAMAETLFDRTGRNIAGYTRLQRKRRALTVLVVGLVVFGVAHAACFT
ncbi:hypothetical protein ABAC402_08050 [Asticcacaulis sp. AC402]|nr:hypothetical protein ABAC402_08050 [Asticcacaulis sp. AC402]